MKKIGLLGGISWVSTLDYYRYLNEGVNAALGGLNFAECVVYSLNFNDIQRRGWDDWDHTYALLLKGCLHLKAAGAEAIVLCANTAHVVAERLEAAVGLPIIHIADATARDISRQQLRTVGLLGTKFTMELPFFQDKLSRHGIRALIPEQQDTRDFIQRTLRDELGRGMVSPATKSAYLEVIRQLVERGAEGIVFGCTELPLLLSQADVPVPVFDTTRIHIRAALEFALADAVLKR
ncbi:aspartate racemase [Chromobacterium alkanivorans]|uniref:aspartate/glutamate racemase family protein n=1 Tax=Chromobacterium alkanivorans TaxID=1071719 RepID=UPI002168BD85|nr:aspartate/glutamate racemase family protein [Chromobacterium alkanivorans]MCS3804066.1 aspartate racemase [Chromobacterium alkanivorans]MCS3818713.1 aspartate racemase [Chromobacterium alkanivorans]MCS3876141.1 aspartate racemase [Chromobacterium alkanivorans]